MNKELNKFLDIEVDTSTKENLLRTIERLSNGNIECEELNFNMYDVIIYPKKNEVKLIFIVSDDENPIITIPLDKFYAEIEKW